MNRFVLAVVSAVWVPGLSAFVSAQTIHTVELEGILFTPADIAIDVGDTVRWVWVSGFHDVESGETGVPAGDGIFTSGAPVFPPMTFEFVFDQPFLDANLAPGNVYPYYCSVHFGLGMTGTVTVQSAGGCIDDLDCDDGNPCAVGACVDNVCHYTGVPDGVSCADELFCNGEETCLADICTDGAAPCPDPAYCDETNHECLGACCFDDDICFDGVGRADCAAIEGRFLGSGLTCGGDADGDGVYGCDDGCPLDANKIEPGICGCGVADDDSDMDTVPDCVDLCPDTFDVPVDGHGCSTLGACCFSVGVCIDETIAEDCAAVRGVFQGQDSFCGAGCRFPGNGDFNDDGQVDLLDFWHWLACETGPGSTLGPKPCKAFDLDGNETVDIADFRLFQLMYTGCGNGTLEAGEQCDDGGESATCDADCTLAECGDGMTNVTAGEECDDGNTTAGDGCSATCQSEAGGPENDNCANPTPVGDGETPFDNNGAMTDGPSEEGCNFPFDDDQIGSDIWYCYQATCDGEAVVSLCDSAYDTKLAVYNGCACPTTSPLACDDDGCRIEGRGSRVTFQATSGQEYLIRIGGFAGAQGEGTLNIRCGGEVCGPGNGDCGVANGTRGCEDTECCGTTCDVDPFCCDVAWDQACADEAPGLCTGSFETCSAEAGSCAAAHEEGEAGCDQIECCNTICMDDPFCCIRTWDDTCARAAMGTGCFLTCGGEGSCFTAHTSPGCGDEACCQAVCTQDAICCEDSWDQTCAEIAAGTCR